MWSPPIVLALLALAGMAAPARAQLMATPYLHGNFGDVEFRRGGPGISVGYLGGRLGFELDVDRHHHFFKDAELESVPNACRPGVVGPCIDSDTDAWIFMGTMLVAAAPAGRWRPFGTTGVGAIHSWIHGAREFDDEQTDLALNVGGGVLRSLNDWLALRGDVRYFRAFVDENASDGVWFEDYGFFRIALGVTFLVVR
jgi:hypothetical protein